MCTDSELQKRVTEELRWRPDIDASQIGVSAEGGVVTLNGQVRHYMQRTDAENAARQVQGVRGVANGITVDIASSQQRSDQDIAKAATNALKWNFQVPDDSIQVVVNRGVVTLKGTVEWQFQRSAAHHCIHHLIGVAGVINDVILTPGARWRDVTSKIEDAFARNANLEADKIHVATAAGVVTLSGSVKTMSQLDQAAWAAWSAPGVSSVNNDIAIVP